MGRERESDKGKSLAEKKREEKSRKLHKDPLCFYNFNRNSKPTNRLTDRQTGQRF